MKEFMGGFLLGVMMMFFIALITGVAPLRKENVRLEAERDLLKTELQNRRLFPDTLIYQPLKADTVEASL